MAKITERVEGTVGDGVVSEISYWKNGKMIGFWAYGYYDPGYPYAGRTWIQSMMWKAKQLLTRLDQRGNDGAKIQGR